MMLKIFCSSLSTGLNSMAAIVLEDFWKPYCKELSAKYTQILIRAVVIILGLLCVGKTFFKLRFDFKHNNYSTYYNTRTM